MTRRYLSGCLAGIVFLPLSLNVWAQSFNATLTGSVTDPSGLPVPAVELTLTPVGTGVPVRVTSGSDGLFSFPNLQSGEYERVGKGGKQIWIQASYNPIRDLNGNLRGNWRVDPTARVQQRGNRE